LKTRLHIALHGAVQGVGFRPFVYRLATEMGLSGWVMNSSQGVFIEVDGEKDRLDRFILRIENEKPDRAFIQGMETSFLDAAGFTGFGIKESSSDGEKTAFVLPDIATCPECEKEIFDPTNRRYLYPFTNCTNCGPRFSIIQSLPYDRPNTTMQKFEMCDKCKKEYNNPSDRRFHAQPNACPECGPHLELWDNKGNVLTIHGDALRQAAEAIRSGRIVALKGIGGFQLVVNARNEDAVKLLRVRKHREEKPFALMYPSLEQLRNECEVSELEERLLLSPEAPIVLLRKKKQEVRSKKQEGSEIAESVAPRNPYLGAMLPYTPLHHMLLHELSFPVVATSGNISDEPICVDEQEALEKLGNIADVFLVHDRPIERHVDDSVVREMAGRVQVVRRARGYAPFPIQIQNSEFKIKNVLAVGGHLKNTIAVNSGDSIFISQHIGDLSTEKAFQAFEKVTNDFRNLFEINPRLMVHDLHPDYLSTQFAEKFNGEKLGVQHHFAHVAACMAENRLHEKVLGISWDGTGYGEDGTVWGGEFLLTDGASYDRVATLRSFRLPGNSAAIKQPRRSALGVLYEIFGEKVFEMAHISSVAAFDSRTRSLLKKVLRAGLNSPVTTSAGRLFDAVSSIIGLRQVVNFEGQGAMELEFAIGAIKTDEAYKFEIIGGRRPETGDRKRYEPSFVVNWEPMINEIIADVAKGNEAGLISAKFHNTLGEIIVSAAKKVGEEKIVISGGCFQNKYLTERTIRRLNEENFKPYWHQRVPTNDGGISLGQMFVALNRSDLLRQNCSYEEVASKASEEADS